MQGRSHRFGLHARQARQIAAQPVGDFLGVITASRALTAMPSLTTHSGALISWMLCS